MRVRFLIRIAVILGFAGVMMPSPAYSASQPGATGYPMLVQLFTEWRAFEAPVRRGDIPDYTPAAVSAKAAALPQWFARLAAIDTAGWTPEQLNDLKLVKAEMNGLDFDLRVLRPWARDPAFYVSVWAARTDVPAREGPLADPEIALYNYHFPLSAKDQHELAHRIGGVPALLAQARENLKHSNARDLWIYGAQELRNQSEGAGVRWRRVR